MLNRLNDPNQCVLPASILANRAKPACLKRVASVFSRMQDSEPSSGRIGQFAKQSQLNPAALAAARSRRFPSLVSVPRPKSWPRTVSCGQVTASGGTVKNFLDRRRCARYAAPAKSSVMRKSLLPIGSTARPIRMLPLQPIHLENCVHVQKVFVAPQDPDSPAHLGRPV
jgi:hypothetical protein